MGWRLAEEVAWARPERPGPEWWTLMDIAQDARDETRQSMCGTEYLMRRAKCSKATLYRRLDALRKAKLITVVRHSAPGVRAIYEVAILHELPVDKPRTGLTNAETCSGVDNSATGLTNAETCSPVDKGPTGLTNGETRTVFERSNRSQKAFDTGLSVSETHAVTTYPVTNTTGVPVSDSPVEGSGPSTGQERDGFRRPSKLEVAAWQAAQSRNHRINGTSHD